MVVRMMVRMVRRHHRSTRNDGTHWPCEKGASGDGSQTTDRPRSVVRMLRSVVMVVVMVRPVTMVRPEVVSMMVRRHMLESICCVFLANAGKLVFVELRAEVATAQPLASFEPVTPWHVQLREK
eukprot:4047698-Prymnesium_polylepis.1